MSVYRCPTGHEIHTDPDDPPECDSCNLIATHYNSRTGEVWTWTDRQKHENACRQLQEQIDAAFDHQFFDEL